MKRKIFSLAGSAFLLLGLFLAGCSSAQPQKPPLEVIKDAMKKMASVSSYNFNLALDASFVGPKDVKPASSKINLTLGGSVGGKEIKDPKFDLKLAGSLDSDGQGAAVSGMMRLVKGVLYFNVDKFTPSATTQLPSQFSQILASYVNKWWKWNIPADIISQMLAPAADDKSLTPKQKQMNDLIDNTKFFNNPTLVKTEDVQGESSYDYHVVIDKQALIDFVQKASVVDGTPITPDKLKSLQDGLAKADLNGDVWVGANSGIVNQLVGNVNFSGMTDGSSGTIVVKITFGNVNKAFTVEEPQGAVDFSLPSLGGPSLGGDISIGGGSSQEIGVPKAGNGLITPSDNPKIIPPNPSDPKTLRDLYDTSSQ